MGEEVKVKERESTHEKSNITNIKSKEIVIRMGGREITLPINVEKENNDFIDGLRKYVADYVKNNNKIPEKIIFKLKLEGKENKTVNVIARLAHNNKYYTLSSNDKELNKKLKGIRINLNREVNIPKDKIGFGLMVGGGVVFSLSALVFSNPIGVIIAFILALIGFIKIYLHDRKEEEKLFDKEKHVSEEELMDRMNDIVYHKIVEDRLLELKNNKKLLSNFAIKYYGKDKKDKVNKINDVINKFINDGEITDEEKKMLFFLGTYAGSRSIVKYFVENEHVDVNITDKNGTNALWYSYFGEHRTESQNKNALGYKEVNEYLKSKGLSLGLERLFSNKSKQEQLNEFRENFSFILQKAKNKSEFGSSTKSVQREKKVPPAPTKKYSKPEMIAISRAKRYFGKADSIEITNVGEVNITTNGTSTGQQVAKVISVTVKGIKDGKNKSVTYEFAVIGKNRVVDAVDGKFGIFAANDGKHIIVRYNDDEKKKVFKVYDLKASDLKILPKDEMKGPFKTIANQLGFKKINVFSEKNRMMANFIIPKEVSIDADIANVNHIGQEFFKKLNIYETNFSYGIYYDDTKIPIVGAAVNYFKNGANVSYGMLRNGLIRVMESVGWDKGRKDILEYTPRFLFENKNFVKLFGKADGYGIRQGGLYKKLLQEGSKLKKMLNRFRTKLNKGQKITERELSDFYSLYSKFLTDKIKFYSFMEELANESKLHIVAKAAREGLDAALGVFMLGGALGVFKNVAMGIKEVGVNGVKEALKGSGRSFLANLFGKTAKTSWFGAITKTFAVETSQVSLFALPYIFEEWTYKEVQRNTARSLEGELFKLSMYRDKLRDLYKKTENKEILKEIRNVNEILNMYKNMQEQHVDMSFGGFLEEFRKKFPTTFGHYMIFSLGIRVIGAVGETVNARITEVKTERVKSNFIHNPERFENFQPGETGGQKSRFDAKNVVNKNIGDYIEVESTENDKVVKRFFDKQNNLIAEIKGNNLEILKDNKKYSIEEKDGEIIFKVKVHDGKETYYKYNKTERKLEKMFESQDKRSESNVKTKSTRPKPFKEIKKEIENKVKSELKEGGKIEINKKDDYIEAEFTNENNKRIKKIFKIEENNPKEIVSVSEGDVPEIFENNNYEITQDNKGNISIEIKIDTETKKVYTISKDGKIESFTQKDSKVKSSPKERTYIKSQYIEDIKKEIDAMSSNKTQRWDLSTKINTRIFTIQSYLKKIGFKIDDPKDIKVAKNNDGYYLKLTKNGEIKYYKLEENEIVEINKDSLPQDIKFSNFAVQSESKIKKADRTSTEKSPIDEKEVSKLESTKKAADLSVESKNKSKDIIGRVTNEREKGVIVCAYEEGSPVHVHGNNFELFNTLGEGHKSGKNMDVGVVRSDQNGNMYFGIFDGIGSSETTGREHAISIAKKFFNDPEGVFSDTSRFKSSLETNKYAIGVLGRIKDGKLTILYEKGTDVEVFVFRKEGRSYEKIGSYGNQFRGNIDSGDGASPFIFRGEEIMITKKEISLEEGDIVIAFTDGVGDQITTQEISEIINNLPEGKLSSKSVSKIVERIVSLRREYAKNLEERLNKKEITPQKFYELNKINIPKSLKENYKKLVDENGDINDTAIEELAYGDKINIAKKLEKGESIKDIDIKSNKKVFASVRPKDDDMTLFVHVSSEETTPIRKEPHGESSTRLEEASKFRESPKRESTVKEEEEAKDQWNNFVEKLNSNKDISKYREQYINDQNFRNEFKNKVKEETVGLEIKEHIDKAKEFDEMVELVRKFNKEKIRVKELINEGKVDELIKKAFKSDENGYAVKEGQITRHAFSSILKETLEYIHNHSNVKISEINEMKGVKLNNLFEITQEISYSGKSTDYISSVIKKYEPEYNLLYIKDVCENYSASILLDPDSYSFYKNVFPEFESNLTKPKVQDAFYRFSKEKFGYVQQELEKGDCYVDESFDNLIKILDHIEEKGELSSDLKGIINSREYKIVKGAFRLRSPTETIGKGITIKRSRIDKYIQNSAEKSYNSEKSTAESTSQEPKIIKVNNEEFKGMINRILNIQNAVLYENGRNVNITYLIDKLRSLGLTNIKDLYVAKTDGEYYLATIVEEGGMKAVRYYKLVDKGMELLKNKPTDKWYQSAFGPFETTKIENRIIVENIKTSLNNSRLIEGSSFKFKDRNVSFGYDIYAVKRGSKFEFTYTEPTGGEKYYIIRSIAGRSKAGIIEIDPALSDERRFLGWIELKNPVDRVIPQDSESVRQIIPENEGLRGSKPNVKNKIKESIKEFGKNIHKKFREIRERVNERVKRSKIIKVNNEEFKGMINRILNIQNAVLYENGRNVNITYLIDKLRSLGLTNIKDLYVAKTDGEYYLATIVEEGGMKAVRYYKLVDKGMELLKNKPNINRWYQSSFDYVNDIETKLKSKSEKYIRYEKQQKSRETRKGIEEEVRNTKLMQISAKDVKDVKNVEGGNVKGIVIRGSHGDLNLDEIAVYENERFEMLIDVDGISIQDLSTASQLEAMKLVREALKEFFNELKPEEFENLTPEEIYKRMYKKVYEKIESSNDTVLRFKVKQSGKIFTGEVMTIAMIDKTTGKVKAFMLGDGAIYIKRADGKIEPVFTIRKDDINLMELVYGDRNENWNSEYNDKIDFFIEKHARENGSMVFNAFGDESINEIGNEDRGHSGTEFTLKKGDKLFLMSDGVLDVAELRTKTIDGEIVVKTAEDIVNTKPKKVENKLPARDKRDDISVVEYTHKTK